MIKRFLLTIWSFLMISVTSGQAGSGESTRNHPGNADSSAFNQNELTIYVIPSTVKYDWSSPHTLYKSYVRNCIRNLFKKESYLLGHAFIELHSPLFPQGIFTGMRSASRKEQKDLVLKQHYGLSILGADTEGRLETDIELGQKVNKFSRKGQLAYMTFLISDEATERLIQFFNSYKAGIDSNGSYGVRYGGAFWPRYKGEGAGCSAFAVSFLDLAGILEDEFDEWLVKINIPMELIGGPYNQYNDVRLSDIKKHESWCVNNDTSDYEYFEIYDPTLMYDWIQEMWDEQEFRDALSVTPMQLNQSKGIRIDGRNLPVPENEGIFMQRDKPSIFIDYYHQKYTTRH